MVHHEVRDEGARETARLLLRVLHQERVHRPEGAGHALAGRRAAGGAGGGGGAGGAAAGERRGGIRGGADTTPAGAAGARWAVATGGAVSAPRGSTAAPAGTFTGNTLLQTAQRARRPPGGILPGATRYPVSAHGPVTLPSRSGCRPP